jgi:hypothetical protein
VGVIPERTPAAQATSPAAVIALVAGIVGLFALPILFGPVALVAGVLGAQRSGSAQWVAVAGMLLGIVATLLGIAGI